MFVGTLRSIVALPSRSVVFVNYATNETLFVFKRDVLQMRFPLCEHISMSLSVNVQYNKIHFWGISLTYAELRN